MSQCGRRNDRRAVCITRSGFGGVADRCCGLLTFLLYSICRYHRSIPQTAVALWRAFTTMCPGSQVTARQVDLTLTLTSIYDPQVHVKSHPSSLTAENARPGSRSRHERLRRRLRRAPARPHRQGLSPSHRRFVQEEQDHVIKLTPDPPCGACRAAGKTCIVPAKVVDAWLSPIVFAVGR